MKIRDSIHCINEEIAQLTDVNVEQAELIRQINEDGMALKQTSDDVEKMAGRV